MARRITLVCPSLSGGGAQRIASVMANHWGGAANCVSLITLDSVDNDQFELCHDVQRIGLELVEDSRDLLEALRNNVDRISRLRRAIRRSRPDVVVSLVDCTNVLTLMACAGTGLNVVVCERTDPRHHKIGRIWSALRRWTYPHAHSIVVQTQAVARWVRENVSDTTVHVVSNPVIVDLSNHSIAESATSDTRYLLCAGRLSVEKGFDLAIEAFGMVAGANPNWKLRILGDGPHRVELENLVAELGIDGRVELPGWSDRPFDEMRSADLFVLPSRYEGFPNALLEAMACGLPAISFDCDSGPSEIIRIGIDGLLAPPEDVDSLAMLMHMVMSDGELRQSLAQSAVEVAQRFSREKFFVRWDRILEFT